jgi:hypothetical protein
MRSNTGMLSIRNRTSGEKFSKAHPHLRIVHILVGSVFVFVVEQFYVSIGTEPSGLSGFTGWQAGAATGGAVRLHGAAPQNRSSVER